MNITPTTSNSRNRSANLLIKGLFLLAVNG